MCLCILYDVRTSYHTPQAAFRPPPSAAPPPQHGGRSSYGDGDPFCCALWLKSRCQICWSLNCGFLYMHTVIACPILAAVNLSTSSSLFRYRHKSHHTVCVTAPVTSSTFPLNSLSTLFAIRMFLVFCTIPRTGGNRRVF